MDGTCYVDMVDSIFANLKLNKVGMSEFKVESGGIFRFSFGHENSSGASPALHHRSVAISRSEAIFFSSNRSTRAYIEFRDKCIAVVLVVSGEVQLESDRGDVTYRRGDIVAVSTESARRLTIMPEARICAIGFRADDARRLIERLIGRPPEQALSIAAPFRVPSAPGRMLAALIHAAISGLTDEAPLTHSLHTGELLQDSMLALLLENLPHNYSERIVRSRLEALPWAIRKAMDYIAEHAREDIAVADVALAAGLSLRSLQHGFRRCLDSSPQDYLKLARLRGVRRELLDAGARRSVEDIARDWGFSNRGHFATQYRKLYGELPSQTRRSR